jgi:hypothetical protein
MSYTAIIYASANENRITNNSLDVPLRLLVSNESPQAISIAAKHFASLKETLWENSNALGFTHAEVLSLQIGTPFSIYSFDEEMTLISNKQTNVLIFPILSLNKIDAIMEVSYDFASEEYNYTFGRKYAEELDSLRYSHVFADNSDLIIGHIRGKLFATDGTKVSIFLDKDYDQKQNNSTVIHQSAPLFKSQVNAITAKSYMDVTKLISGEEQVPLIAKPGSFASPSRAYPNPLPLTHVPQVNICGLAAWASVYNYRFSHNFTETSLGNDMTSTGYWNGIGVPSMTSYRDYTNYKKSAGVLYNSAVISFSTTKSAIDAGKPIMGNWWSNETTKRWHAITINGYSTFNAQDHYYVRNPWFSYQEVITFASTPVTYLNNGTTWTLSDSIY